MKKLFSIITVNLNDANGLEKSIDSLKKQVFKNLELIVIDGKSQDNSLKIIKREKNIINKYLSEKDNGIYDAMNKGLELATGRYVFFLNAGDCFYSNKTLSKVAKLVKDKNPDIIYGNTIVKINEKFSYLKKEKLSLNKLKQGIKLPQQAFFIKNKILQRHKFDLNFKIASDFNQICQIYKDSRNKISYINSVICSFDGNGISSNLKLSYEDTHKVIKKQFGNLYASVYLIKYKLKLIANSLLSSKLKNKFLEKKYNENISS